MKTQIILALALVLVLGISGCTGGYTSSCYYGYGITDSLNAYANSTCAITAFTCPPRQNAWLGGCDDSKTYYSFLCTSPEKQSSCIFYSENNSISCVGDAP